MSDASSTPRPHSPGPSLLVQTWLLLLLLLAGALAVLAEARHDAETRSQDQVLGVARSLAASPFVLSAVQTDDPTTRLSSYALGAQRANELDFVVVMSTDRTMWTHADPRQVGEKFSGRIDPATEGETFTETSTGAADPSVRAVSPVLDPEGEVVALVAAGTTTESMAREVLRRAPLLLLPLLTAVALAYAGGPIARRRARQLSARARRASARPSDA